MNDMQTQSDSRLVALPLWMVVVHDSNLALTVHPDRALVAPAVAMSEHRGIEPEKDPRSRLCTAAQPLDGH